MNNKSKFCEQLNTSFGNGGMSCALDHHQTVSFIQFLKREVENLLIKKAVIYPGKQTGGIFVLNDEVHIDKNGVLVDSNESEYVFLQRDIVADYEKFTSEDLTSEIVLPLNTSALVELLANLRVCLKHNFIPALLVLSGSILAFHYRQIVQTYGGCPLTIASGASTTGKSTSIVAALSLMGLDEKHVFVKGTNAAFLDRSSKSGLPYGIDDPNKGKSGFSKSNMVDLGELAVDLYNGSRTANMKTGSLQPRAMPIIATNFQTEQADR